MDKQIARLNIQHFRKKLDEETDEAKQKTLRELLAEEEVKLERLESEDEAGRKRG